MRGLRTRSKACDRKNQKTKKKRTFDSTPMTVSHVDPSLTNHVISVWRSHYVIKQLQGVWPQKQKKTIRVFGFFRTFSCMWLSLARDRKDYKVTQSSLIVNSLINYWLGFATNVGSLFRAVSFYLISSHFWC